MKVCVLWVAAVIVNVLTYRLISVAALDFQKKTSLLFTNSQRAWGNAWVTRTCPRASARTHARGLYEFTNQPPPQRTSKMIEIYSQF